MDAGQQLGSPLRMALLIVDTEGNLLLPLSSHLLLLLSLSCHSESECAIRFIRLVINPTTIPSKPHPVTYSKNRIPTPEKEEHFQSGADLQ